MQASWLDARLMPAYFLLYVRMPVPAGEAGGRQAFDGGDCTGEGVPGGSNGRCCMSSLPFYSLLDDALCGTPCLQTTGRVAAAV